ncbi:capsid protein [Streptomyces nanhaiensis]|uniref:capsid protein n=1 Tax=Streptomyces nanhaiensis TaxID=679319 RepID=UPI00399D3CAD
MPLPDTDVTWPPTDPTIRTALADWDAWYSSDPDRLANRYTDRGFRELPESRPAQYRNGVLGRLARWFWGNPTPPGEKVNKLHVPLAGDIARVSSELLFAEPPRLLTDHTGTQDALDTLMHEGLHPTLLEAGEVCSALGGAYLRIVWDEDISPLPWIDTVPADRAHPEFAYGRLRAVTFWSVLHADGNTVLRHLERHERGAILHGLYEGNLGTLGRRIPLAEHPATAPLAGLLDGDNYILTGAPDHLTAAYIPNVRPARAWRNLPAAAGWGQSDFQGIEGVMDALDETYSSWMRDVQNGKGRVIVPNSMLETEGPGQGAMWHEERRIYSGLNMLPKVNDPNPIEVVQFDIRVEEHRDTCAELIERAVRMAGYSAATFGEGGEGASAVTATEIRARQRRSMTTRGRKALYAGPALGAIGEAWLAVAAGDRFRTPGLEVGRPRVEFQDSISESPRELAETADLMHQAAAASTETRVRLLHPDWDDAAVQAETDRVMAETGVAVPSPGQDGLLP